MVNLLGKLRSTHRLMTQKRGAGIYLVTWGGGVRSKEKQLKPVKCRVKDPGMGYKLNRVEIQKSWGVVTLGGGGGGALNLVVGKGYLPVGQKGWEEGRWRQKKDVKFKGKTWEKRGGQEELGGGGMFLGWDAGPRKRKSEGIRIISTQKIVIDHKEKTIVL